MCEYAYRLSGTRCCAEFCISEVMQLTFAQETDEEVAGSIKVGEIAKMGLEKTLYAWKLGIHN